MGGKPDTIDPATIAGSIATVRSSKSINFLGKHAVDFNEPTYLVFLKRKAVPDASNAIRFKAYDASTKLLIGQVYFSIGDGSVVTQKERLGKNPAKEKAAAKYDFKSGRDLLDMAKAAGLTIADVQLANERCWRSEGTPRRLCDCHHAHAAFRPGIAGRALAPR